MSAEVLESIVTGASAGEVGSTGAVAGEVIV